MIAAPFVAGAPAGARVRTRLRVSPQDAAVLRAVGLHLGSLAGRDLAARCAEGRLDAGGPGGVAAGAEAGADRRGRRRGGRARSPGPARTSGSSPTGTCTPSEPACRARVRRIEARAAVPAGGKNGRVPGYATPAERHAKTIRLKVLKGRLARTERRLETGPGRR